MAAVLPVIGRDELLLRSAVVHGVGAFGDDVASRLGVRGAQRVRGVDEAFATGADLVVTALPCERRAVLAQADELAFDTGTTWLPVVLDHPWLRVGPLIVPGADGPCYECFTRRLRQHGVRDDATTALHAAYEEGTPPPTARDRGHVALAVALVERVAAGKAGPGPRRPGAVLRAHLFGGSIAAGVAVGLHGCRRCDAVERSARAWAFRHALHDILAPGQAVA
jgi:bacteriocin biosynthesis cyclodehydratase domain-containing protein